MRVLRPLATALPAVALACLFAQPLHAAGPPPVETRAGRLVRVLGDDDFATRERAQRELLAIGAPAVPALRAAFDHPDPEVRRRALVVATAVEKRTEAYFKALGADVWRDNSTGHVTSVSYTHKDASKLKDADLRELIGLPWLIRLWLDNAKVGDAGMAHLSRLTNLDYLGLDGTLVTDCGLAHLAGLSKLQTLWLNKTRVTGRGLVHLGALNKLENLGLFGGKVTDAGLAAGLPGLLRLKSLHAIYLSDNSLTDEGLATLARIKHPIGFDLRGTRVTDKGLARLRRMPNLLGLVLDGLPITDKGCGYLAEIKTIRGLSLNDTRVSLAGLRKLKDLPRLKGLEFMNLGLSEEQEKAVVDIMPRRVMLTGNYKGRAPQKP